MDSFNSVQLNYKLNHHNYNLGLFKFSPNIIKKYKLKLYNIELKADPHTQKLLSNKMIFTVRKKIGLGQIQGLAELKLKVKQARVKEKLGEQGLLYG